MSRPTKAVMAAETARLRREVAHELSSRRASGLNVSLGNIEEEYVPELKTIKGRMAIYERMANDPQIRGQLRAITMTLVSGVRWKVEGGTQEMRDLVESNLLGRGDPALALSTSWLDFLYEAMGVLIYGFAAFATRMDPVDGRLVFRDLTWIHPRCIDEDGWVMDESDNLLEVRRSYTDASGRYHTREPIPARDLFLLTWDRRGPNWEGNAFIRAMYRPWKLNEIAEKIDIIDLQNRGVGIPMAKLSGSGSAKERDTLISMLKSLRGGSKERAFLVIDKDEDISFLTSTGQAKDAGPVMQHHQANIVKTAGTEYFEQGNTASGSRAGASALATGFFINVDGIRVLLEDQINEGSGSREGLVKRLVDANFDAIKEYPRICGSRVSPTEQLDNIPLIQDAIAKGAIPPTLSLANEMLTRLGWPALTEEEWDDAMEAKKPASPTLGPGSPANGGPGRPNEAGPDPQDRENPIDQTGLSDAQKKTLDSRRTRTGATQPPMRRAYRWLNSTADGEAGSRLTPSGSTGGTR